MLREKSFQCNGPLRTIFRDICSVQRVASFWKQFKSVTCLQIRVRNIRCESAFKLALQVDQCYMALRARGPGVTSKNALSALARGPSLISQQNVKKNWKNTVQRRCCLRFAWKKRKWAEECCQSVAEMWDASLIRIREGHLDEDTDRWLTGLRDSKCGVLRSLPKCEAARRARQNKKPKGSVSKLERGTCLVLSWVDLLWDCADIRVSSVAWPNGKLDDSRDWFWFSPRYAYSKCIEILFCVMRLLTRGLLCLLVLFRSAWSRKMTINASALS